MKERITVVDKRAGSNVVDAEDIPFGFFFGRIYEVEGLFLKAYRAVVLVRDPSQAWEASARLDVEVEDYVPATVTIHAEATKNV